MPFDEDDPKEFAPKIGVKPIVGQKSMFDKPRRPTQQEFQKKVQGDQDKISGNKRRAAELFIQFQKTMADKTLVQNKNIINNEVDREMLQDMIKVAMEMNDDTNEEHEGTGSLALITVLLITCLAQKDRANQMEYAISVLQKKTDSLSEQIKEITNSLDKKIISE
jgi:hypothetical protein